MGNQKEEKKGFLAKLIEKLDKKMEKRAKTKPCCPGKDKDKNKPCCSG